MKEEKGNNPDGAVKDFSNRSRAEPNEREISQGADICEDLTEHSKGGSRNLVASVTAAPKIDRKSISEPGHKKHKSLTSLDGSLRSKGSTKKEDSRIGRIYRITSNREIHPVHSSFEKKRDGFAGKDELEDEDETPATWKDVCTSCCCHTWAEWVYIFFGILSLLFFLFFFLLGLELLGTSFKVVGGCTAGSMLGSDTNPLASVMIGIITTALLQSSSTTSAIIVTLVSGGLDVHQAIYMIMGANIGTSVTCMIVSLAHMGDSDEFERAFAGSSILWVFNFFTVIILLPIEIATQYLYYLTKAMLPSSVGEGNNWEGPIKKIVSPLGNRIIMSNRYLIERVSNGESCDSFYPVECEGGIISYDTCLPESVGLIGCDKKTQNCPVFFMNYAGKRDDMVSGWVCLIMALFLLIFCLIGLVTLLRKMLLGTSTRIIYKATNVNDYVAMVIGCTVTILVQSSSITSSVLVPLAGVGILDLEQMYPLILGSDIGTTFTALMAAMVSSQVESLQIALVHLFFNVTGVLIWYPIPFNRRFAIGVTKWFGKITRHWHNFPVIFIIAMYFILPILLYGISSCFEKESKGFKALGAFILLIILIGIIYATFWWKYRNGKDKLNRFMIRRQRRAAAIKQLADDLDYLKVDMEYVKNEMMRMKDYAGLPTLSTSDIRRDEECGQPGSLQHTPSFFTLEDDQVSLYQSCQSLPWQNILVGTQRNIGNEN